MSGAQPALKLEEEMAKERKAPRRRSGRTPPRRAGLRMSMLFVLLPPAVGGILGGTVLTSPDRVPWVLVTSFLVALVCFALVRPLGRRSDDFKNAVFRRSTELAVLGGLSACGLLAYTLVVYILLGFQEPWLRNAVRGLLGA